MECNKDEATRARDIAERKLAGHDYSGALKFLQKAQQLFPGLDNLVQMSAVVNVHIAAQKKINGTEIDWYGILQVDPRADDVLVKKQYRRLALLLHPDKNKFPGAESAFKLVGEASQILSDKQQRSVHDYKRAKPAARTNKTTQSRQHPQGTRQYSQASSQHVSSSFVTACPSCQGRFRIFRIYENVTMACPQCHAPFQARDILSDGVYTHTWPPQFPQPQPGFSHNPFQSFPSFFAAAETFFKANKTDGSAEDQIKRDQELPGKAGTEQKSKRRRGNEAHNEKDSEHEQKKKAKADLKAQETLKKRKQQAEKKKRRSQKYHSESSDDDDDSSSSLDDLSSDEQRVDKTETELGRRRSSRPRRNVRYKMDESDDDEDDLQESHTTSDEDHDRSGKIGEDFDKDNIVETGVSSTSCKDDKDVEEKGQSQMKTGKCRTDGQTGPAEEHGTGDPPDKQAHEADEDTADNNANFTVPDADYYDFDKDREEKDVETGQVWAGYDDKDGMPRYYFRVKDVLSHSPFEVNISWLELRNLSKHQAELKGLGFSLTCGSNFRSSRVQTLDSVNMFSHIVKWEKGPKGAILIYPRTGDVWALYKDWNPSLDCMKGAKSVEYAMVEVLTDFNEQTGVRVAHLQKLNGYKTIFKCTEGVSDIPASELTRFSHQVPAHMLTGEEASQVPVGCWQLDPASVPIDLIFPNSGIS